MSLFAAEPELERRHGTSNRNFAHRRSEGMTFARKIGQVHKNVTQKKDTKWEASAKNTKGYIDISQHDNQIMSDTTC